MLASIVIPAYKPYELLSSCLSSILKNTDEHFIEIIVVCNGSDRESADLILNNFPNVRLVWYKEPLGFTKAANIGFSLVESPITIIMNTDVEILDFCPKNYWLDTMLAPFSDPTVGLTGIGTMYSEWTEFLPFFFTAIRTELFQKIGYLDLDFSPGYGEDLDFCFRAKQANYKLIDINKVGSVININGRIMNSGNFPMYHKGEGSFKDNELRQRCLENAHIILNKKYGPGNKIG